ncbi:hypothetical protein EI94DRAFT_1718502 [Lactarius quietus]|nr:hypothetical protein EI94DRAFT_1718502 [Lactarius quietus]
MPVVAESVPGLVHVSLVSFFLGLSNWLADVAVSGCGVSSDRYYETTLPMGFWNRWGVWLKSSPVRTFTMQ